MADDLNDEWWNHETDNKIEAPTDNAEDTKESKCNVVKQKKRRRRKRITDVKLKENGSSPDDLCNAISHFYDGKLSVVEKDAMSLEKCHFGPVNQDMSHTVTSLLKEALPKWQRLCTSHSEKKSPMVIILSSGAVRALHLNKEASLFKGIKCKTAKLFARHMKQEAQAKFLKSNVIHFAIGTPARVSSLIAEDSLSLVHTKIIMLDWNYRDSKLKRMIDIPDIKKVLYNLLKDFVIPACKMHRVKIAMF